MKSLFTIGHEGRTDDELLSRLKTGRIGLVVDVGASPLPHKPVFSMNALAKKREGVHIANARRRALDRRKSMCAPYKRDRNFSTLKAAFDKYLGDQPPSCSN